MAGERGDDKGLPAHLAELRALVVAYLRQETLEPIKRLGRFIAFGVAGSALAGIGALLLALAGLRALQTETGDVFDGNWSWAPYVIVVVGCAAAALLAIRTIGAPKRRVRSKDGRI